MSDLQISPTTIAASELPVTRRLIFAQLVRRLGLIGGVVAVAGCLVIGPAAIMPIEHWLAVSLASLLIGLTASIPCLIRDRRLLATDKAGVDSAADDFMHEFFGCVALRLLGTVALIVGCRYLLGDSILPIGIAIIGWYLLLTGVEVFTMAQRGSITSPLTHVS